MEENLKRIEDVLETQVRPSLRAHGGEIAIDHLEDGVLYVKLLGQCAGCPSADLTNETIVEAEVVKALPDLVKKVVVVQTVSDELWEQAKRLLRSESATVGDAAIAVGIEDVNYFSRLFRKKTGQSPSQYKRGEMC